MKLKKAKILKNTNGTLVDQYGPFHIQLNHNCANLCLAHFYYYRGQM